jgi:integrase/recombinase XerD
MVFLCFRVFSLFVPQVNKIKGYRCKDNIIIFVCYDYFSIFDVSNDVSNFISTMATTSIYLDTRRSKQDQTYPVKIRVTHNATRKYYALKDDEGLPISLTEDEFTKVMGAKPRGEFKNKKIWLESAELKAREIIKELPAFTFDAFEKKYLKKRETWQFVSSAFDDHIKDLRKDGKINTASTYETAKRSFLLFSRKKLQFEDITVKWLQKYESWAKADGKSVTTISINTRALRRLFNIAIKDYNLNPAYYPFGNDDDGKYQPPQHFNNKRALSKQDILKIYNYEPPPGTMEHFCRDIWLMSYLSNGMNLSDIFKLKYHNIEGNEITFLRSKTSHKRKNRDVVVSMHPEVKNIIERWGNKPREAKQYIFNLLSEGMKPEQQVAKIKSRTKTTNDHIKKIAKKVGITANVSTYSARHSFATISRNEGAEIGYISEALGHSGMAVTENYLSSFGSDQREKYTSKLL